MLSGDRGESVSVFGIIAGFSTSIGDWFRTGDPPALLIFGLTFITMWMMTIIGQGIWVTIVRFKAQRFPDSLIAVTQGNFALNFQ
jgi:hypothetical protein